MLEAPSVDHDDSMVNRTLDRDHCHVGSYKLPLDQQHDNHDGAIGIDIAHKDVEIGGPGGRLDQANRNYEYQHGGGLPSLQTSTLEASSNPAQHTKSSSTAQNRQRRMQTGE